MSGESQFLPPKCGNPSCQNPCHPGKPLCIDHYKEEEEYSYGLDHDLQRKLKAKWNPTKAAQVKGWLETLCGEKFEGSLQQALKDGTRLCKAINVIKAGMVKNIYTGDAPFKQRENIVAYLNGCKSLGMSVTDLFVSQDLYEGSNMVIVIDNILALGGLSRYVETFSGPYIGPERKVMEGVEKPVEVGFGAIKQDHILKNTGELKKSQGQIGTVGQLIVPEGEIGSKCSHQDCEKACHPGKTMCLDHYKVSGEYVYGIDADLKKKLKEKWDPEQANNVNNG